MNIINKIKAFLADENGAESVEWVMVAAIVAGVIAAAIGTSGTLRTAISDAVARIVTAVGKAT